MAHQHEVVDDQAAYVDPTIRRARLADIFKNLRCVADLSRKLSNISFSKIICLFAALIMMIIPSNLCASNLYIVILSTLSHFVSYNLDILGRY
jgi:hypothetical protein